MKIEACDKRQAWRVVLLDDHPLVRDAYRALIESEHDLTVLECLETSGELTATLRQMNVDVVMMDYRLADDEFDGVPLIQRLRSRFPATRLLVCSASDDAATVAAVFLAGAQGFLSKAAPLEECARAIRAVAAGLRYAAGDISPRKLADAHHLDGTAALPLTSLSPSSLPFGAFPAAAFPATLPIVTLPAAKLPAAALPAAALSAPALPAMTSPSTPLSSVAPSSMAFPAGYPTSRFNRAGAEGRMNGFARSERRDDVRAAFSSASSSLSAVPATDTDVVLPGGLTIKEFDVLRCTQQGLTPTAIAAKFKRSVKTVSGHKVAAYRKLAIESDAQLYLRRPRSRDQ